MSRILESTNAAKAQVIALLNALFAVFTAFNVGLSDAQTSAIIVAVNAAFAVFVAMTYKRSPKRVPDA